MAIPVAMRVFVAGATGVLGRPLVRELSMRGHEVVGLARSIENEATLASLGASYARADLFDAASLARAMEGSDVVVRAATHIPKGAWTASEVALMDRVRIEGTRALLAAAKEVGARKYVQESVSWVDEATPSSALDAERQARAAPLAATTLRFAWFYGSASAHTRQMVADLKAQRLVVPGEGQAQKSLLHVDDAARAIVLAVEADLPGVWEVADERPVTVAEFFDTLADAVRAARPRRGGADDGFLSMQNVADASRFRKATGWAPTYPTIREGAREVASATNGA